MDTQINEHIANSRCQAIKLDHKLCTRRHLYNSIFCKRHLHTPEKHWIYARCHYKRVGYECPFYSRDRTGYCGTHQRWYAKCGETPPLIKFVPTKTDDILVAALSAPIPDDTYETEDESVPQEYNPGLIYA